jgi:hypothetical protein
MYAHQRLPSVYNRGDRTLAVHLRVLGRLLSMKDPSSDGGSPKRDSSILTGRLHRYVIATCYMKMMRRLKHKTLSQPYITSLQAVETSAICFDTSKFEAPTTQWTKNDWQFLNKFLKTTPQKFQDSYPALIRQAGVPLDQFQPLYTADTCAEFH